MNLGILLGIVIAAQSIAAAADTNLTAKRRSFFDIFKPAPAISTNASASSSTNAGTPSVTGTNILSAASLSSDQISAGLKEAIGSGLTRAIASLGRTNGFLTNVNVRIPMPDKLAKIEKTLRATGQNALADEFIATMNHAAEQAVPAATEVFVDSLKQMTIADAQSLLQSKSQTAATDYFRRTTTNQLTAKFLPIVQSATAQSGVTAAYKNLLSKASFAATFISQSNLDIDHYVTAKSLDGLFTMVADEEKRIRENPQARTTALLQKVFGAFKKPVN